MLKLVFGAPALSSLAAAIVAPDFGKAESLWAAALITISPAMVFYSRYYIHEMLLVFFTALSFFACWRYAQSGRAWGWALTEGIGLGLPMAATKETFVFAVAALVLSIGTSAAWKRFWGLAPWRKARFPLSGAESQVIYYWRSWPRS